MKINMIVAIDIENGIGNNGSIPWKNIREDMKHFREKTIGNGNNAVIMGRKTMESIPSKLLSYRANIILSKSLYENDNIEKRKELFYMSKKYFSKRIVCSSIHHALDICYKNDFDEVWIIGGGMIYKEFLEHYNEHIYKCYITKIYKKYNCDTYFPELPEHWKKMNETKIRETIVGDKSYDPVYIEEWINDLYKYNI